MEGGTVFAVNGVSYDLHGGESLGIVGEPLAIHDVAQGRERRMIVEGDGHYQEAD